MEWKTARAKGRLGELFVQNIFETSNGYKILPFGVETRSEDIKKLLKGNYSTETNKKIHSMPDFVVVDEKNGEAYFIEVKFSAKEFFNEEKTQFMFRYGMIQDYIKYWKNLILIIVFDTVPFCTCVKVNEIDVERHRVFNKKDDNGVPVDYWKFNGIYRNVKDVFPKIKSDDIARAVQFLGVI